MKIKNREIGSGNPTYIIAEMSANHAGSIEHAKEIIYAAKEAGADCIKVQTYTADTMTMNIDNSYFRVNEGLWKNQQLYDLYKKGSMPWGWQGELKELAEKIGIDFFSTPFDRTAVDFLESIDIGFYKIASFELVDIPLIKYIASKGKPIIMSTGMANIEEIEDAVNAVIGERNNQLALMKCSSAYPAITEGMNIRTMVDLAKRFNVPVGLSDHSEGSFGAVVAVSAGANIIEKHICLSNEDDSPDAAFSMNPNKFSEMVSDVRRAELALGRVDYHASKQEQDSLRYRRSIFVREDIKAGEIITEKNICIIRPSAGLKPKYYEEILGKTVKREIERGTPLLKEDINW